MRGELAAPPAALATVGPELTALPAGRPALTAGLQYILEPSGSVMDQDRYSDHDDDQHPEKYECDRGRYLEKPGNERGQAAHCPG